MPKVVLIGDSTIDNIYWVHNGKTVTDHLSGLLSGHELINFAVDGFTTESILYGEYKDFEVISPNHPHEYFKPLQALQKHTDVEHIVLSVLGNDFRVELSKIIFSPPEERGQILHALIERIIENYLKVIEEIREITPQAKIHLLLQYTPYLEQDPYLIYFLMDKLNHNIPVSDTPLTYFRLLYHRIFGLNEQQQREAVHQLREMTADVYRQIFKRLAHESLAVLDLSSSFDCRDPSLYESQIEPSVSGGKLIAHMIAHSIEFHDFTKKSRLYVKPSSSVEISSTQLEDIQEHWFPGRIISTKEEALLIFKDRYNQQLKKDKAQYLGLYGLFALSRVSEEASLEELITHAQNPHNKGYRTLKVMQNLGWLKEDGDIEPEGGISKFVEGLSKPTL